MTDLHITTRTNAKGIVKFWIEGRGDRSYATEIAARNAVREIEAVKPIPSPPMTPALPAFATEILEPCISTVRSDWPTLDPDMYWVRFAGQSSWSGPYVMRSEVDAVLAKKS